MNYTFDNIDFSNLNDTKISNNTKKYDETTTEIYRIKRLFKVDALTGEQIPDYLKFEFIYKWDPYTGEICEIDEIGPLCFNAITLYDYIFKNRYKGLWNNPEDGFHGYYGDLIGTGINLEIKSRGSNIEKYLFRLPIIDCYLPPNHNYALITMGPLLSDENINTIDNIVIKYHVNGKYLTPLKIIKKYYDNAINNNPKSHDVIQYKKIYKELSDQEAIENINRIYVDKLVNLFE
jgi:hypothetical protein